MQVMWGPQKYKRALLGAMACYALSEKKKERKKVRNEKRADSIKRRAKGAPEQGGCVQRMLAYAGVCWRMLAYADVC